MQLCVCARGGHQQHNIKSATIFSTSKSAAQSVHCNFFSISEAQRNFRNKLFDLVEAQRNCGTAFSYQVKAQPNFRN